MCVRKASLVMLCAPYLNSAVICLWHPSFVNLFRDCSFSLLLQPPVNADRWASHGWPIWHDKAAHARPRCATADQFLPVQGRVVCPFEPPCRRLKRAVAMPKPCF